MPPQRIAALQQIIQLVFKNHLSFVLFGRKGKKNLE
jgi:hypothetical protein